jgi:hypothetical protein
MNIGITGHQELSDSVWVKQKILEVLRSQSPPLMGITSLAVGADQLFAYAMLECNGTLLIIVPFGDYIDGFEAESRQDYKHLLDKAKAVEVLKGTSSHEEAYFIAGKRVVDLSDLLVAVWDGKPAAGLGGTGDVVEYAKSQGKRHVHINPISKEVVFVA